MQLLTLCYWSYTLLVSSLINSNYMQQSSSARKIKYWTEYNLANCLIYGDTTGERSCADWHIWIKDDTHKFESEMEPKKRVRYFFGETAEWSSLASCCWGRSCKRIFTRLIEKMWHGDLWWRADAAAATSVTFPESRRQPITYKNDFYIEDYEIVFMNSVRVQTTDL